MKIKKMVTAAYEPVHTAAARTVEVHKNFVNSRGCVKRLQ